MPSTHSVSRLHVRYKGFQKAQRDIWESFCIVDFYVPRIKLAIKKGSLPPLDIDRIWNETSRTLDKNDTYGALSSLMEKGNYRRTLLETVLIFEDYMSDLISAVYLDYPKKLLSTATNETESDNTAGYQKLLRLVLEVDDRDEIIDRLVEEKVRGIFYGNPIDVFMKDKARMGFDTYFKDTHQAEIGKYKIIVAARNLVAHNNGKIDRKFIREADSSAVQGKKFVITREFLKESTFILSLLAAHATRLVIENVYKGKPAGNLGSALAKFNQHANN